MKNVLCPAEKSSVIWAKPHSRSLAEQFGRTECSVNHYLLNCNLMQKPQFKYVNSLKIKFFDNFNFWNSLFWIWALFFLTPKCNRVQPKKLFDFIKNLFCYLCLTASNVGYNICPLRNLVHKKFGPHEYWFLHENALEWFLCRDQISPGPFQLYSKSGVILLASYLRPFLHSWIICQNPFRTSLETAPTGLTWPQRPSVVG